MNLIKRTLISLKSPIQYLLIFFMIVLSFVFLFTIFKVIFENSSNTALKDLISFDLEKSLLLFLLTFLAALLIISIFALTYIVILERILKREYEDKRFFNILKFIGLCFFLFGSLMIFNTTQFATLVGVISIAALIWPRIKE